MTPQEKIAALPPMPELPRIGIVDVSVHYARLLIALHARNALLCEALRDQAAICNDAKCKRCALVRAVLAACEVTP